MSSTPLDSTTIPGFKVVPKHQLAEFFQDSQSAFFVLIGRRGRPEDPRESVLFVDCVDDLLEECQRRIEELWTKHRVAITHVGVKPSTPMRSDHPNLTEAYQRAIAVQELRHKLNPRFRRV